jgi:hypothetical protein
MMKFIFSSPPGILRRFLNLRKVILLAIIFLSTLFSAHSTQAQSGIELDNVGATVDFGEQITFVAVIKSSVSIQNASILIFDEAQGTSYKEPLDIQSDGRTEFHFNTKQNVLRPFTNLKWNYQFTLSDGSTTQSESYSVRYVDNRFQWQTLESGNLRVNWYGGDSNFGQAALNTVQSGLGSVSNLIAVDLAQPIEFFIYANADDLRATLSSSSQDWIAGHADPALGVVMVVIEPGAGQNITMEQRIPHELMHVMLYRAVGAGYYHIPAWLNEGTATLAEMYPNADYDRVLKDAAASNDLIPLNTLCASFPADMGQAFLAYAESRSFTSYLHQTYGSSGLLKLATSYADGVDCDRGTELAFGLPLPSLEAKWRSSILGQNAWLPALQNMTPYLVLLCVVLIFPFIGIVGTLRKKGKRNEPETFVED